FRCSCLIFLPTTMHEEPKKVVFLEGVTTWTITPGSVSVGSDSRKVVKLAVALQGSNSGEIVYEFHPLWEADK
ncbi:hypothetical protein, partial [Duodenibacillus massiliensis]|uniref:hypothetical protein n=1 Tax=Duodenibacillus massiliensis TaxID=1852381 RepID=UPI00307B66FC